HDAAEDHHQRVHRRHLVEEVRADVLQARDRQLQADHDAHRRADDEHQEAEEQVERADVLVVRGEEPALDEALLVLVVVAVDGVRIGGGGHGLPASGVFGQPAAGAAAAEGACAATGAALAFSACSHCSYSATGSARTTIGMKAWSLPHSSAHWPR